MGWVDLRYSKSRVDAAGKLLSSADIGNAAEVDEALRVLGNWRAAHGLPLNAIQLELRAHAGQVDSKALIVQRLKRTSSIIKKLRRSGKMRLSQMQDIGGCRAVVRSSKDVYGLRKLYGGKGSNHELVNEKDYISVPPASGYRSVHLVYCYRSRNKKQFDGRLVEVQLRSAIQHAWATAVETVDAFLGTDLKAGQGPVEWKELFALLGSAFALAEGNPLLAENPSSPRALRSLIKAAVHDLGLVEKLEMWRLAVKIVEQPDVRDQKYVLLDMRPSKGEMKLLTFSADEFENASGAYLALEKEIVDVPLAQAVLVSADSINALRRAYPNYFLDSSLFIEQLRILAEKPLQRSAWNSSRRV